MNKTRVAVCLEFLIAGVLIIQSVFFIIIFRIVTFKYHFGNTLLEGVCIRLA